jgi:hypothetical protein
MTPSPLVIWLLIVLLTLPFLPALRPVLFGYASLESRSTRFLQKIPL